MSFGDGLKPSVKNTNLRPLLDNPYGTSRWNFSGKPLSSEEIATLRSRGVTDEDWMPDGRLKLTKFQKRWKTNTAENRLRRDPVMKRADFDNRFSQWWDE